ncbi:hypothetical protein GCM10022240_23030 [Microbacterium kribbense]|uniref:Methyltransferase n=1 Tax=Microbacterium kribbense TaxID=433645 RepID=A0ABP7GLT9_9MICO
MADQTVWVAHGETGVVGMIHQGDDGFTVTKAGADAALGTYPTMAVAKSALYSAMAAGSDWPRFEQH